VENYSPASAIEDFYLYCGQFVPYKRADIAVEAFNRLGKKLVMVGEGGEEKRLRKMARPNIQFAGSESPEALRRLYATCRALIFPGEEDFGIVPVEAMASGRPVIAYEKGGIRDSVRDGISGILYPGQDVESLLAAIARFEKEEKRFVPTIIAADAARFSATRFRQQMESLVDRKMTEFRKNGPFLV